MYWGYFYLACTFLTLWYVRNDPPCLVGAVGLLMWTGLEKLIYQYGIIETDGTLWITAVFWAYVIIADIFFKKPLIFMPLGGVALGTLLWTTVGEAEPYEFKKVKNMLYAVGLVAICLNHWLLSRPSSS